MKTFCFLEDTRRNLGAALREQARRFVTIGFMIFAGAGCAGTQVASTPIHDDALSSVFLEPVRETSFQAAHPLKLPEATVADLLRGLHIIAVIAWMAGMLYLPRLYVYHCKESVENHEFERYSALL